MNIWLHSLKQNIAEKRAARAAATAGAPLADPRAELRGRITRWWSTLAQEDRQPRYLLEQIAPMFRCTQQQLGVALHELGWKRKRVWKDDGPYRRYWLPPVDPDVTADRTPAIQSTSKP